MLNLVTLTAAPGSEASVRERRAEKEAPASPSCGRGFGKGAMAASVFWVCVVEMQRVGMGFGMEAARLLDCLPYNHLGCLGRDLWGGSQLSWRSQCLQEGARAQFPCCTPHTHHNPVCAPISGGVSVCEHPFCCGSAALFPPPLPSPNVYLQLIFMDPNGSHPARGESRLPLQSESLQKKIALSCCVRSNSVLVSGGELARKQGSLLRVRD